MHAHPYWCFLECKNSGTHILLRCNHPKNVLPGGGKGRRNFDKGVLVTPSRAPQPSGASMTGSGIATERAITGRHHLTGRSRGKALVGGHPILQRFQMLKRAPNCHRHRWWAEKTSPSPSHANAQLRGKGHLLSVCLFLKCVNNCCLMKCS